MIVSCEEHFYPTIVKVEMLVLLLCFHFVTDITIKVISYITDVSRLGTDNVMWLKAPELYRNLCRIKIAKNFEKGVFGRNSLLLLD